MNQDLPFCLEINVTIIAVLIILKIACQYSTNVLSSDKILFKKMLNITMFACVADIFSIAFDSTKYFFSYPILQLSNMIYIGAIAFVSYVWILYVYNRIGVMLSNTQKTLWAIPVILFLILDFSNPLNSYTFTINAENVYSRNWGVYVQWVVSWFYVFSGFLLSIHAIRKEKNKIKKRALLPLIYFVTCPSFACMFQMCYFGLSTIQCGIALGILLVYVVTLSNEVSCDTLTGLNNRGGMENYLLKSFEKPIEQQLCAFMLDLNDFKSINDKLGHDMGDKALKDAGEILQKSCKQIKDRLFLCRFGGDEFVILGRDVDGNVPTILSEVIREEAHKKNAENQNRYIIEFSIGYILGHCSTYEDAEKLLKAADNAMYLDKQKIKKNRSSVYRS